MFRSPSLLLVRRLKTELPVGKNHYLCFMSSLVKPKTREVGGKKGYRKQGL